MYVKLDSQTLDVLAAFICGDEGSHGVMYRSGQQLPKFFKDSGLLCIDFDGTTRKKWTFARLVEYNHSGQIDKVLLRLVEPLEYQKENNAIECAKKAAQYLNTKLILEKITFKLKEHKFALSRLTEDERQEVQRSITFVKEKAPSFARPGIDIRLEAVLVSRWEDAQRCWECNAFAMSIICMGSLLEGVLLCVITGYPAEANQAHSTPKKYDGKPRPFEEWSLHDLLVVANECGWILRDRYDFSQVLRNYRNIVHPWHQAQTETLPDNKTCAICWEVVKAAVKDLLNQR